MSAAVHNNGTNGTALPAAPARRPFSMELRKSYEHHYVPKRSADALGKPLDLSELTNGELIATAIGGCEQPSVTEACLRATADELDMLGELLTGDDMLPTLGPVLWRISQRCRATLELQVRVDADNKRARRADRRGARGKTEAT